MASRNDDNVPDHVVQTMGRTAKFETIVRRYTFVEVAALGSVLTGFIDPTGFPTNVWPIDVTTRIVPFGGTTTMVIDVGIAANTDQKVDNVNLQVADLSGTHQAGDGTHLPFSTHEAAYAPRVTFTSTVEDLDQADAGAVEITWTYHGAAPSPMVGAGDGTLVAS